MNRVEAEHLIAIERRRQIEKEGWTPEHDDEHDGGALMAAADAYCDFVTHGSACLLSNGVPKGWPWDTKWWKPKGALRDLVRAGALFMAEHDRLSRKQGAPHGVLVAVDHKCDSVIEMLMKLPLSQSMPD